MKQRATQSRATMALSILLLFFLLAGTSQAQHLSSPNGRLQLDVALTQRGQPTYTLSLEDRVVIQESQLGIELSGTRSLVDGFSVFSADTTSTDETWSPVWGQERSIRNNYRELAVTLVQSGDGDRSMILRFRLFDDGLGFRYEFPAQNNLRNFIVTGEKSTFDLTGDHTAFWIPGDYDTNEYAYSTTRLSDVDATIGRDANDIAVRTIIGADYVQTPLMLKSDDGLYINIHEAALQNYPAMNLRVDRERYTLTAQLVPDAVGNAAYLQTPTHTPWRTIIVSADARDILRSRTILNLNEPSRISDTAWIRPAKYVGIWWGMHIGKYTWNYSDVGNTKLGETDWSALPPNGRHGATTENTRRYIDFAADHGFDGVLVEGWNVGWEDWFGQWKEEVFDFVTPYPDFDVEAVTRYAESKGVELIMHHETSASVTNYERRLDEAFAFMKRNGYNSVKTGYVGRIIPRGEHHDGQWMVNHYNRVAEKAAENRIMIDAHEPVRPTGLHRTWPNWLASEAARGNEFNSGWSPTGNPPEHETILPFTRLMGGPMDYTPGIFQIRFEEFAPERMGQMRSTVQTTLAKQLALYVTMYSPLQMAADLPENYEKRLDALKFIEDVAVDWDQTVVAEAEPGDYITIARKAKTGDSWFIGAITDENPRTATINLDFLDAGRDYVATLYLDAPDADFESNPMAYRIETYRVSNRNALRLDLARSGGAAVSIRPASATDEKRIRRYKR